MYHQFFGLQKEAFGMTPDPAFLYLTAEHREALAGLTYAILSRKGFVVLTGEAGTGKTSLLTRIFHSIPAERVRFSVVLNPTLTPAEFLELALLDFGVANVPSSKAQRLTLLQELLLDAYQKRQAAVLVVDEAQKLPPDVLEEIRLLSNFEQADAKLLQIVLSGQTELGEMLNRHELRQLKQRIAVRLAIHPLAPAEVDQYIAHRWRKAGATRGHPFQPHAVACIAQVSRGIPRLINALCDNALMLAYGEGSTAIEAAQIAEVARDLDLAGGHAKPGRLPQTATAGVPLKTDRSAASGTRPLGLTIGLADPMAPPPAPIPSLERYATDVPKASKLTRLADMLGITSRPV